MIIRIFQVRVRDGKEEEFAEFFYKTEIPMMKGTEGIVQVLPGAPHGDCPRDFSFVMVWNDLASLKAFVGEDYIRTAFRTAARRKTVCSPVRTVPCAKILAGWPRRLLCH